MKDLSVRYGQGAQTLRFVPTDRAGRPVRVASATYTIVDLDEGTGSLDREIASGSATLAAVNTTTSAAAGAGQSNPRAVTLTSAALVTEGRQYLLSTANGRSLVTVDALTGSVVTAKHTPSVAFPSGSAFQSIELEATFPADEANDSDAIADGRRYQIVWVYTLQGEQWCTGQIVRLTRYSGEPWITEEDVLGGFPTLADRIRGKFRISDAIAAAQKDVLAEIESAGKEAEYFRTSVQGEVGVRNRAIEYAHRWLNNERDDAVADLYLARWEKFTASLMTGTGGTAINVNKADDMAEPPRIDGLFERP